MALRSPSGLLVVLVVVVVVVQVLLEPAALAQCTSPSDPCAITLDCTSCDETNGGNIPNPEDCHSFYICVNDTYYIPIPATCPDGETFDLNTLKCNATAECFSCTQGWCDLECSDSSMPDTVPHPTDCTMYYKCENGAPSTNEQCENERPFYDGKTCQTEETLCCRCQPSCAGGEFAVIDPLDCRKYWLCPTTDPPKASGTCTNGFFDTTLLVCSSTATCETTCPNVVNTTGCIDPFICLTTDSGLFAMCPNLCVNQYYDCEGATGEYQEPVSCPTGTFFHPDNHLCVNRDDCPYPDPEFLHESLRMKH